MAKQQHHVPCPTCTLDFLVPVGAMIMGEEDPETKGIELWWEDDTATGMERYGQHRHTMSEKVLAKHEDKG